MQKHFFKAPFASQEAEVLSCTYESPSCEIIMTAPAFSFLSGGDGKGGDSKVVIEDLSTDPDVIG